MLPKYLSLHMNVLSSNQNIFRISFFELCAKFVKKINSKSEYDWQKL